MHNPYILVPMQNFFSYESRNSSTLFVQLNYISHATKPLVRFLKNVISFYCTLFQLFEKKEDFHNEWKLTEILFSRKETCRSVRPTPNALIHFCRKISLPDVGHPSLDCSDNSGMLHQQQHNITKHYIDGEILTSKNGRLVSGLVMRFSICCWGTRGAAWI